MRVKVCGICRVEDALAAADAGADAVGCLVGLDRPSPEQVTAAAARALFSVLPPFVARVLVTHKTTLAEVADLVRESTATAVQLHGDFPLVAIPALREAVPFASIVKCVHVTGEEAIAAASAAARVADAILLDTKARGRIGGTGKTHDWSISARIALSMVKPVILAGGLNPDNVAEAIARVRPFGVDANSGTRATPGAKDHAKIRAFVANAVRT
ncbi:MAG TPA: phosphoribosylanthranilate isomerase [Candidatus Polarisedimenticolaceae bacterium]|nr:phosphoribosylanthranilate isomerase [Candidatus Polarisedimenticolaceae bacterium]